MHSDISYKYVCNIFSLLKNIKIITEISDFICRKYCKQKCICQNLITHIKPFKTADSLLQWIISDKQYASMPLLFHQDNFDKCMLLEEDALYCSITYELQPLYPSNSSEMWNIISVCFIL